MSTSSLLAFFTISVILSTSDGRCICSNEEGRLIFSADLTTGRFSMPSSTVGDTTVAWREALTASSLPCSKQGVLKITFPEPRYVDSYEGIKKKQTRYLVFDFYFSSNNSGFNINIGDSFSNNGYGGDGGHTSNAAEVHSKEKNWNIYTGTLPGYTDYAEILVEAIQDVITDHVTVIIGDEYAEFDNNRGVRKCYSSKYLFTLSGQTPTYGNVNYDIYFGMNRVISSSRSGIGLCSVTIREIEIK